MPDGYKVGTPQTGKSECGTHNILWTSGWDSTFQLVRLLVRGRTPIQPFYLIDESRASTAMELRAMQRIKEKIHADLPERADQLLPVRFVALSDLAAHDGTARAIAEIRKKRHIGIQYDWLARFCRQFDIQDLELCIHKDDRAHKVLQDLVREVAPGDYRIDDRHAGSPAHEVFGRFSFPVFELTKLEMQAIAAEQGFSDIMALTWFCHSPKHGKPCGRCSPCLFTIDEGLGWRIPQMRRWRGRMVLNARKWARSGTRAFSAGRVAR